MHAAFKKIKHVNTIQGKGSILIRKIHISTEEFFFKGCYRSKNDSDF